MRGYKSTRMRAKLAIAHCAVCRYVRHSAVCGTCRWRAALAAEEVDGQEMFAFQAEAAERTAKGVEGLHRDIRNNQPAFVCERPMRPVLHIPLLVLPFHGCSALPDPLATAPHLRHEVLRRRTNGEEHRPSHEKGQEDGLVPKPTLVRRSGNPYRCRQESHDHQEESHRKDESHRSAPSVGCANRNGIALAGLCQVAGAMSSKGAECALHCEASGLSVLLGRLCQARRAAQATAAQ